MEHGYGTAETLGYEGIPEGVFVEAAHISSTMAGDHDFQLVYSVDEQPMLEPAHIWFEEPVGFGLDLSPWREDAGWSALEALIIHEGEDSVESLRLVSADGVALIGDGDLTVLQDGSGELGEVGEGVEVTGGELQIDLVHVDADGPGTLELLDGTVVSVPAVRVVEDYDELDADWTLQVLEVSADGEQAEHLALQVDERSGQTRIGERVIRCGDFLSINGFDGSVYLGQHEVKQTRRLTDI